MDGKAVPSSARRTVSKTSPLFHRVAPASCARVLRDARRDEGGVRAERPPRLGARRGRRLLLFRSAARRRPRRRRPRFCTRACTSARPSWGSSLRATPGRAREPARVRGALLGGGEERVRARLPERRRRTTRAKLPKTTFSEEKKVQRGNLFFGVETRDASTTFERFCAAGSEAGFAAEPHPRLMDLERFERFALDRASVRLGSWRIAAAHALRSGGRGAVRVDVSGFFAAVAAVARHKALSPADAVECVKRARLSGLATVGVGGNDERFASAHLRGGGGCRLDARRFRKRRRRTIRNPSPASRRRRRSTRVRSASPIPAAPPRRWTTRSRGSQQNQSAKHEGGMGIPLSSLARVMADVGALAGVPLVEAGAAIAAHGSPPRLTPARARKTRRAFLSRPATRARV